MKRKSLTTLIRINKYELDQRRRRIGEALQEQNRVEDDQRALEQELLREQTAAENSPFPVDYNLYANRMIRKREDLGEEHAEAVQEVEKAREAAVEVYRDVKKFETMDQHLVEREFERAKQLEQADLDEVGLEKFRRRAGDEPA